jgi:type I restriction-modification system DNA methylase subunit
MDLSRRKAKLTVPEKILNLVEKFDLNINKYKKGSNEAEVRNWFIDPLFEALGWDVRNLSNKSPNQTDVRLEDTLESGKRPDYSFWINGKRKFFVDAKDPSVNIERGINPAFQVKRYGWSSNMALVIVTDFEEFAIYDCRTEPFKSDRPDKARFKIIKYYEFEKRWDEIASLFSKESVQNGSLESVPRPKGKKVDEALLEDISSWRKALAVNIAKMNPSLDQKSLNHAVQMTIDRILFLRICEDRSIEDDGRLRKLLDGENVYQRLFELFIEADKRYNSGLFHFHAEEDRNNFDTITTSIQIEDNVLKSIIKGLYYPDSPYVFSEIPAEILGHVYEQFLGKVIQLDENRKVDIEFKPEVRKAGGVYYTPSYIVDYIVKSTVGKLLDGKSPKEASDLRILDPACGSGSFLIGAYQYILDWHLDWYKSNLVPILNAGQRLTSKEVQNLLPAPIEKPDKNAGAKSRRIWERASVATLPIEQRADEWHLRTAERKRILLNNIHGVDIDTQAVEVTKLSLLLKVLEGENNATIADLTMYSDERALPDLGTNIKCGNSLIGWDIQKEIPDLTQAELVRINPFTWEEEFKELFAQGGFDVVIGNPPYLRIQGLQEHHGVSINYIARHYQSAIKRFDFYLLFIEKGFKLLNSSGKLGFICPHKFVNSDFGSGLRNFLIDNTAIDSIISFGNNLIFKQASTYTCILLLSKIKKDSFGYYEFKDMAAINIPSHLSQIISNNLVNNNFMNFSEDPWILTNRDIPSLLNKLNIQPSKLGEVCEEILVGI